jgi:type III secretory pathway lipoprotein EscJ
MKHFVFIFFSLLLLAGCKHDDVPVQSREGEIKYVIINNKPDLFYCNLSFAKDRKNHNDITQSQEVTTETFRGTEWSYSFKVRTPAIGNMVVLKSYHLADDTGATTDEVSFTLQIFVDGKLVEERSSPPYVVHAICAD